jgi:glycosyltransferase involved in cell wall biosynthesis
MDAKNRRVLLLIDRLGGGGAAQVVLAVALALNRAKFSPIVCTTRKAPTYGQDELLRRAGVPLIELNRHSHWQLLPWIALWRVLPTLSILHSHESGSNFWARLWGKLFRVPIIITQDHTAADEKRWITHLVDRTMSPLSNRIVTVSEFDRDLSIRFEKLPQDKVVTIYNGINVNRVDYELTKEEARRLSGLPEDSWLFAVTAVLKPQKNHHGFFKALALLPEDLRSQGHCLIVGSGKLEDELRNEVRRLGLQELVSFLGERTDVPTILRAIDLLVLPSHWECLPIVILEALAAKCPIVASAVGGVPEVLDGLGWPLVTPSDPSGLAEAITDVFQMPMAERNRIAEAGRQVAVERFSAMASVAQVQSLYDLLLAQIPRGNGREYGDER